MTDHATTFSERAARIQKLASHGGDDLQALLEAGASAVLDGKVEADLLAEPLAREIAATFKVRAPLFGEGDTVAWDDEEGKVVEARYLSEGGAWEYSVAFWDETRTLAESDLRERE